MTTKLQDLNRRNIPLQISQIKETLPEFFRSEYPQFITFLEKYYEFLDSDGRYSFGTQIHQLFSTRDVDQTPDELFDLLGKELGSNLSSTNIFEDKRYSIRRFGELYRNKGTEKGLEQFFRSFFNVEPTISYPKDDVFTIGSSKIGPDDLKVIQDYERFQTLSILYKVPLGINTWRELYEKYAHPAGFYFAVDVELVGTGIGTFTAPLSIEDSATGPVITETALISPVTPFQQLTVLVTDESTGIVYRSNPLETIEKYEDINIDTLDSFYDNVAQIFTPNSFKFDDSNASADSAAPDFSLTFETMDQEMFDSYGKAF